MDCGPWGSNPHLLPGEGAEIRADVAPLCRGAPEDTKPGRGGTANRSVHRARWVCDVFTGQSRHGKIISSAAWESASIGRCNLVRIGMMQQEHGR